MGSANQNGHDGRLGRPLRVVFLSNANSLHLREWAEYLALDMGHEVTVLTIPRLGRPYRDPVRTVQVAPRWLSRKPSWPILVPRIRRELRRARADVFVGYRVVSYGFLASLCGFHPLVLAAQGGHLTWPPDDPLRGAFVRYALRRADLMNAWSNNIKHEMLRHGANPRRLVVLSRGIDLSLFPALPEKPPGPPTIALTRSLLPSYNTAQIIAALPHVLREIPDGICEIAGDGPLRRSLEEQAAALGVTRSVRFLGRISRSDIVALLRRAHVYCSMTLTDGLPLSHFEAMASGAVPVCSDIQANRLWIEDGRNGFLAPIGDPETLGRKLVLAFTDTALRRRAVPENRAMVERRHDRRRNLALMTAGWERLVTAGPGSLVTSYADRDFT